jgi:hypothetical protein
MDVRKAAVGVVNAHSRTARVVRSPDERRWRSRSVRSSRRTRLRGHRGHRTFRSQRDPAGVSNCPVT